MNSEISLKSFLCNQETLYPLILQSNSLEIFVFVFCFENCISKIIPFPSKGCFIMKGQITSALLLILEPIFEVVTSIPILEIIYW